MRASSSPILPEEARCVKCDYLLRGLSEARCPECGTPFDPASLNDTFIALWPRLMALLLVAQVIRTLRPAWYTVDCLRQSVTSLAFPRGWLVVSLLVEHLAVVAGGSLAAVLLWRYRESGRRLCIGIMATVSVLAVARVVVASIGPGSQLDDLLVPLGWAGLHLKYGEMAIDGEEYVARTCGVLPLLIGVLAFLSTGMRKQSLARRPCRFPPLLSRDRYGARNDWALLMTLVFATASASDLVSHVEHLKAGLVLTLISPGLLAACAVWIWRQPDRVRLIAMASILAGWGHIWLTGLPLLGIAAYPQAVEVLGDDLLTSGFFFIESSAAFSLAMVVFAFVVLPKSIERDKVFG